MHTFFGVANLHSKLVVNLGDDIAIICIFCILGGKIATLVILMKSSHEISIIGQLFM
jgi:hypothetical protein